ncbi:hypothetical protein ACRRTK_011672 [Alexandromys fortis]
MALSSSFATRGTMTTALLNPRSLREPTWEELAYYEENTRDFLFPEPRLTSSHLGMYREVLMKTPIGFPGIAPKLEFSTRTAIRECVFPHRNRFFVDSVNPFGESSLEHHLPKSRRKSKFLDVALPMRRASSLESLETNIKANQNPNYESRVTHIVTQVTREPDERIVLRSQTSPPLDPRKSGQPSPNHVPSSLPVHVEEDP